MYRLNPRGFNSFEKASGYVPVFICRLLTREKSLSPYQESNPCRHSRTLSICRLSYTGSDFSFICR
jgi:hypothetical protein